MQGQLEDAEGRLQALHDSHTSLIQEQEVSRQQGGSWTPACCTTEPSGLGPRHIVCADRHPCIAFAAQLNRQGCHVLKQAPSMCLPALEILLRDARRLAWHVSASSQLRMTLMCQSDHVLRVAACSAGHRGGPLESYFAPVNMTVHRQSPATVQVSEGRLLESLRAEVASAEGRLEEERASHAAARRAAQQREQQLEVGSCTSSPFTAAGACAVGAA